MGSCITIICHGRALRDTLCEGWVIWWGHRVLLLLSVITEHLCCTVCRKVCVVGSLCTSSVHELLSAMSAGALCVKEEVCSGVTVYYYCLS